MASGTAAKAVNDWQTVEPNDWQEVKDGHQSAPSAINSPAPQIQDAVKSEIEEGTKNLIKGVGQGALHTMSALSDPMRTALDYYLGPKAAETVIPQYTLDRLHDLETPKTPAQHVGYTGEQIGEWLIPGPSEEKTGIAALEAFPKMQKLARIGNQAVEAGLRNKLQGGSFKTGAAVGAGGELATQGMQAVAPKMAEFALHIPRREKGYGKTIGDAILNETRGIHPETIARSAGERLGQLTPEIERMASSHPGTVSLQPALDVIDNEASKAMRRNNATAVSRLGDVRSQLTKDIATGQPIPTDVPAMRALDLKRGMRDQFVHNWNPELLPEVTRDVAKRSSGEIDRSLDSALGDQFRSLNQRESSLIPAKKAAQNRMRDMSTPERILYRIGRPTGALTGAVGGGFLGYKEKGTPGAIAGAVAGATVPELMADPSAQMAVARLMRSSHTMRPLVGTALQLDRKNK